MGFDLVFKTFLFVRLSYKLLLWRHILLKKMSQQNL